MQMLNYLLFYISSEIVSINLENRKVLKTIFKMDGPDEHLLIKDIKYYKNTFLVQIFNELNKNFEILIYTKHIKVDYLIFF